MWSSERPRNTNNQWASGPKDYDLKDIWGPKALIFGSLDL